MKEIEIIKKNETEILQDYSAQNEKNATQIINNMLDQAE